MKNENPSTNILFDATSDHSKSLHFEASSKGTNIHGQPIVLLPNTVRSKELAALIVELVNRDGVGGVISKLEA